MFIRYASILLFSVMLISCNGQSDMDDHTPPEPQMLDADRLIAVIHPTEDNSANGIVTFTREGEGVRVEATISGLDPNSNHGFHIHEYGDCSAGDATSAGGHFNPYEMPHSSPEDDERHMGDLGNLESNEDGEASLNYLDTVLEFSGAGSILGRGVVVHADEDDFETQPTGDAGARIGCAVIGIAESD